MSATIQGIPQLRARIEAIKPNEKLLRTIALSAVREQKLLVPRKTSNLGRSIHIGAVTPTRAETIASANYALYVERGTGLYGPKHRKFEIKPKNKKALRFATNPKDRRLSGSPRKGAKSVIFRKRVSHPGSRAQPFMVPGAQKAVEGAGLKATLVAAWNSAA